MLTCKNLPYFEKIIEYLLWSLNVVILQTKKDALTEVEGNHNF